MLQHGVRCRHGLETALEGLAKVRDGLSALARHPDHRIDIGQHILDPVVEFCRQRPLALLGLLALGNIPQDDGKKLRRPFASTCEIEASMGNSSPPALSALKVPRRPMARLVTPSPQSGKCRRHGPRETAWE